MSGEKMVQYARDACGTEKVLIHPPMNVYLAGEAYDVAVMQAESTLVGVCNAAAEGRPVDGWCGSVARHPRVIAARAAVREARAKYEDAWRHAL